MQILFLLLAALTPVAVLAGYIYKRDEHKKEPVMELFKAFCLGVLSVFVSLCISIPMGYLGLFSDEPLTIIGAMVTSFLGAAIPEEIAKFLMFWLLVRKNSHFDEKMDGIVYASIVALGFAAIENILYLVANYDAWMSVGISRALFSVPGHFFFGVLMGYYYSLYRFCYTENKSYKLLIVLAPILAHGLFDTVLYAVNVLPSLSFVLMLVFLFLCNSLRKRASRSIAEHLKEDTCLQNYLSGGDGFGPKNCSIVSNKKENNEE